jgi:hypothetical protein
MRSLLFILAFLPLSIFAQQVMPYDIVAQIPRSKGNTEVAPPDSPRTVPQGVIKVRKPSVRPYFKCEYYLTLSHVTQVEMDVIGHDGYPARAKVPVFDSSYSEKFERLYPQKNVHFSRQLVDSIQFAYSFEDTASIDTMVVELWIGTNGKIKWSRADTTYTGSMPHELKSELFWFASDLSEWGKGGGYKEPKKFLRKQRTMAENYYCVLYIIASAKPLTGEQRHTGARYAPFDIPLNSPPVDARQKDFIEGNKDHKNDSLGDH